MKAMKLDSAADISAYMGMGGPVVDKESQSALTPTPLEDRVGKSLTALKQFVAHTKANPLPDNVNLRNSEHLVMFFKDIRAPYNAIFQHATLVSEEMNNHFSRLQNAQDLQDKLLSEVEQDMEDVIMNNAILLEKVRLLRGVSGPLADLVKDIIADQCRFMTQMSDAECKFYDDLIESKKELTKIRSSVNLAQQRTLKLSALRKRHQTQIRQQHVGSSHIEKMHPALAQHQKVIANLTAKLNRLHGQVDNGGRGGKSGVLPAAMNLASPLKK